MKLKLTILLFSFSVALNFQAVLAQTKINSQFNSSLTNAPTCIPTVVSAIANSKFASRLFYLIRYQEDFIKHYPDQDKFKIPIDFGKNKVVSFPYLISPGDDGPLLKVNSVCYFKDHIQIEYYSCPRKIPPKMFSDLRYKESVVVFLPQSDLPVRANKIDTPKSSVTK